MSCEECRELNTHVFRSSDDLVHAVQTAAQELDRGVLRRVDRPALGDAEREALQSAFDAGERPASMSYRFECTTCGDGFELSGDSESGSGAWTRAEATTNSPGTR
jgi:hypothetical protein